MVEREGAQRRQMRMPSTPPELAREVADALGRADADRAVGLAAALRAPDLADLIELLEPDQRVALIQALGPAFDYEVLSELDETVRDQLSEALPNELLARAVTELETDDAAYVLESLEESDKEEILSQLPTSDRAALERNLEYPGGDRRPPHAGGLRRRARRSGPSARSSTTCARRRICRTRSRRSSSSIRPSACSAASSCRGCCAPSATSRSRRSWTPTGMSCSRPRTRRRWPASSSATTSCRAPVVDENNRLVGVVTVDDVVEVIQDEADEDMKALGRRRRRKPRRQRARDRAEPRALARRQSRDRRRWPRSSSGPFDATIEQMVALAVLMPIVASMGGNAGTQTMTVTVRALATSKLGAANAPRIITRETLVGLINGLVLSLLIAGMVFVWFGSGKLGAVIGAAMIVNLLAAGARRHPHPADAGSLRSSTPRRPRACS